MHAISQPGAHCRREVEDLKAADTQQYLLPLLLPAVVVGAAAKDKSVAFGVTLVDVVLAAATAFVAAVTAVVVSCCCSLQALQLVLLPLSLVHVLSCCSFPSPEESPRCLVSSDIPHVHSM